MSRPVVLVPYDPTWPQEFEREASVLRAVFGPRARIEHMGSTAVPGLGAKPILDILVGLPDLEEMPLRVDALRDMGYHADEDYVDVFPERRYFRKPNREEATHHLHVVPWDSAFFLEHLLVRDHLRRHPDVAQEYFTLKQSLAESGARGPAFTEGKSSFLQACLQRAREECIRDATPDDAPALLEIYAPLVRETTVSFELEPPSVEEFARRIENSLRTHAYVVIHPPSLRILGYAYGGPHRARAAYRWSAETSVFLHPSARGQRWSTLLYQKLFERLEARGYRHAFAGITLPNDSSVAAHQKVGFEPIGVFPAVGYKHGAYCDVAWYHRTIRDAPPPEE